MQKKIVYIIGFTNIALSLTNRYKILDNYVNFFVKQCLLSSKKKEKYFYVIFELAIYF